MMEVVAKEHKVTIMDHEKGKVTEQVVDDPMQIPRSMMEGWHPQQIDQLPDSFTGELTKSNSRKKKWGIFDFVGYEM